MFQIILFAPLLGALIAGFFGRSLGDRLAMAIPTGLLFLSAFLSWIAFFMYAGEPAEAMPLFRWIHSGAVSVDWTIRVDTLTAVMLVVVTSVSSLVHLYSIGYMDDDPSKARFFAYLSLFTFAMLALVTADDILQLFFGWEGVGLCSYLLIGFWYRKPSANAAAIKAFVVNRVGDFAFLLGIFGLFFMVDSIGFEEIFAAAPLMAESVVSFMGVEVNAAELIMTLLFIGAMGKSAQLFLHTWLPDAMEGPTPVSALIHAATMVTAGVFLVCRMSPLMEVSPNAMAFVLVIGATTAFVAASIGLVQNDIKRVIAYSTCSQLGYMFAAAGVGAYEAAMFHLFTHAFFKALLFLCSGSVILAMHHEQDMRRYGGLRKKIPATYWTMMIGTLAITGVGIPLTSIGFAGFFSKDAIIESVFAGDGADYAFVLLVLAAAMTSFYSWRLMFMTFFGESRAEPGVHEHAKESPRVILIPLYALSAGAVLGGVAFYGNFFGSGAETFWAGSLFAGPDNHVIHDAHEVPWLVKVSPFIAMAVGFGVAYVMYILRPGSAAALARQQRPLYTFLLNKWYFDEVYDFIFVSGAKKIGRLFWKRGDGSVIDGIVHGFALNMVPFLTGLAGRAQSGFIFHYAFAMILGLAALITWYSVLGG